MTKESFFDLLSNEVKTYKDFLETDSKDWIVKGFIDIDKNVYTITNDTKVVSKIIEILLIPKLERFARSNSMTLELPSKQNFYPDLTFKDEEGHLFAVD
ncbi:MAG: type II restriction endonuclease [Prevotella sp.]